jgi:hypothetical protein
MTRIFVKFAIIREIRQNSFGATGRTAGGGAASAGGACSALKLSAAGKSEGRHHPGHFFALAFGAGDFFRRIEDQLFEFMLTLAAVIFKYRHFRNSFPEQNNPA